MGYQATSASHAELEIEQEMLLKTLAGLGVDPGLALDAAMEPLWIPEGPMPAGATRLVRMPASC